MAARQHENAAAWQHENAAARHYEKTAAWLNLDLVLSWTWT